MTVAQRGGRAAAQAFKRAAGPSIYELALDQAKRFRAAAAREPLSRFKGTPPQIAMWSCASKRRLLRTGNQVGGKTTAACVEALWWCTHQHPFRYTPGRPVSVLFVCVNWQQSLAIQAKLWALVPKDALKPGQTFDDVNGFGTKSPALVFADGSAIRIRTENQGAKALAGWTVDLVIYDEPPKSRRIFGELERRLTRTGGDFLITMTPVNAYLPWLRELIAAGGMTDLHFRAEPAMFVLDDGTVLTVPDGQGGVRPMDAEWIAEQQRACFQYEVDIVLHGEWDGRSEGQLFRVWDPSRMVIHDLMGQPIGPRGKNGWYFVGVDYGDDRLRTAAVLVWVPDEQASGRQRAMILAEYVPDRSTTMADDAAGILAMLASRGLKWHHLAGVLGDKRFTDAGGKLTKKSNDMLEQAVSRALGLSGRRTSPPVRNAKRGEGAGQGAFFASCRWMEACMLTEFGFFVDASCARFIEAMETFDGDPRHPRKDVLDGARYALKPFWAPTNGRRPGSASATAVRIR